MKTAKCPACHKTLIARYEGDIVVCTCWKHCPICGSEMTSYTPELTPEVYGVDGKRDLKIILVCKNVEKHPGKTPFYSMRKPVEVECT